MHSLGVTVIPDSANALLPKILFLINLKKARKEVAMKLRICIPEKCQKGKTMDCPPNAIGLLWNDAQEEDIRYVLGTSQRLIGNWKVVAVKDHKDSESFRNATALLVDLKLQEYGKTGEMRDILIHLFNPTHQPLF